MKYPVWFVGAGPGDPELITVKGKRLVQEADRIIYAESWEVIEKHLVAMAAADFVLALYNPRSKTRP